MEQLDEILEETTPEALDPEAMETVEIFEELPEEEPTITAEMQLQAVAETLVTYGGSGSVETVAEELVTVMETLLERHALEVEQSEKVGKLTFALSNLVYDTGAVLAMIDVNAMDFDPSNLAELRDFLDPIYSEKPYLFKVISPLRGANIATGVFANAQPTNEELGALSMEEYTAYRTAGGSASR